MRRGSHGRSFSHKHFRYGTTSSNLSTDAGYFFISLKGIGRNPKSGKKKGGIKVHANVYANEAVLSDIKFTSAATNGGFMLKPAITPLETSLLLTGHTLTMPKFEEADKEWSHICHENEEKPRIRYW